MVSVLQNKVENWHQFVISGEIRFMTKVQTIEKEVKSLNKNELAEFRDWFQAFDSEAWDAQIEQDILSGKLDQIAQEALEEHQRGESKVV